MRCGAGGARPGVCAAGQVSKANTRASHAPREPQQPALARAVRGGRRARRQVARVRRPGPALRHAAAVRLEEDARAGRDGIGRALVRERAARRVGRAPRLGVGGRRKLAGRADAQVVARLKVARRVGVRGGSLRRRRRRRRHVTRWQRERAAIGRARLQRRVGLLPVADVEDEEGLTTAAIAAQLSGRLGDAGGLKARGVESHHVVAPYGDRRARDGEGRVDAAGAARRARNVAVPRPRS